MSKVHPPSHAKRRRRKASDPHHRLAHRRQSDHVAGLGTALRADPSVAHGQRPPLVHARRTSSRSVACWRSSIAACRSAGSASCWTTKPRRASRRVARGAITSSEWPRRSRASTSRSSTGSTTRRCRSTRSSVSPRAASCRCSPISASAGRTFPAPSPRSTSSPPTCAASSAHACSIGMRYASGPRLVAACAPGEQHEIGLLLFALEAQSAGMRVVVLGADTPLEDAAMAQRRSGSEAIVISSSDRSGAGAFPSGPAEAHRRARRAGVRRRGDRGAPSPRRRCRQAPSLSASTLRTACA